MVKNPRFHHSAGSIPGKGTKIPHAVRCSQKITLRISIRLDIFLLIFIPESQALLLPH